MSGATPELSLILPAFNAAGFLERSLAVLEAQRRDWPASEVVLVDDGSADRTGELLDRRAADWLRCLRLSRNQGKGAAVRAGMLAARGRFRIFTDADLPYDLDGLPNMLAALDRGADLVIGARDLESSRFFVPRSRARRIASFLFTALVRRLVGGVADTQCGLKGFRAPAAERLFGWARIDGFAFDVELLYLAHKLELAIERIPVLQVRNEPSTISPARSARMLWDVLVVPVRYHFGGYGLPAV
jgi:dolichyl-phosphate beta-glucosyltransferase